MGVVGAQNSYCRQGEVRKSGQARQLFGFSLLNNWRYLQTLEQPFPWGGSSSIPRFSSVSCNPGPPKTKPSKTSANFPMVRCSICGQDSCADVSQDPLPGASSCRSFEATSPYGLEYG